MKKPKVVFYSSLPRIFRTTMISHLYEIAQKYPAVLLSEELDLETKKNLNNKELFPKLEKIIEVRQFTGKKKNPLIKNRELYKLAKNVVSEYKPDVVVVESDINPFEMYLLRFAKRIGAINLCFQSCIRSERLIDEVLRSYLINAYYCLPSFLPLPVKFFIIKLGKRLKHFLYYWFLPLMLGEKPFLGKSSCYLWPDIGLRDSDYLIALSNKDYNAYIKDGVKPEKIFILSHPLERETTKKFFEKIYYSNSKRKTKNNLRVLTVLISGDKIGFRRSNYSLISKEEFLRNQKEIISQITDILKGWKIFIKPHPSVEELSEIKKNLKSISRSVEVVDSKEPVDNYVEISDVIIGLSPQSTVLFTTLLRYPEKPILSLDLEQGLGGDYYKNFNGIEYIDNKEKFLDILNLIKDNKYQKRFQEKKEEKSGPREFSDINSLLEYLLKI